MTLRFMGTREAIGKLRSVALSNWLFVPVLIGAVGCGKPAVRVPSPPAAMLGAEVGIASWYGHPYHGRKAANGEIYDMNRLTAAHRTLPFNTRVRVRNLENAKSVEVRINDRGPFVRGRIIDLSRAAARSIDMLQSGTARVRLEVISSNRASGEGAFTVQVGAFRERSNADRLIERMRARYGFATASPREGAEFLWRVLVGRESTIEAAESLRDRLQRENAAVGSDAFVVRLDQR